MKDRRTSGYMCKPYAFLIMHQAMSFSAFVTHSGFKRWLKERNLKLRGNDIIGTYKEVGIPDISGIEGKETRVLCNAEYRKAVITQDSKGLVTIFFEWTGIYDPIKKQSLEEYFKYSAIYN